METNKLQTTVVTLVVFVLWTIFLLGIDLPSSFRKLEVHQIPSKTEEKNQRESSYMHAEFYRNILHNGSHRKRDTFPCFKGIFNDTLIVVTYNHPFYGNIEIINKLYNSVFGKVVHCGKEAPSGDFRPDIIADVGDGHRGYVCMARAIEKFPGYNGYLYVNDDMIVNWWRLLNFDRNKVWQGPEIVDFGQGAYDEIKNKAWMWWTYPIGLPACQKSYQDLKRAAKEGSDFDARQALKIYLRNGKGKPRCGKGWSDFFYVPGHLAKTCQRLLEIYEQNKLFLEMAVMNVLHSLDHKRNFEIVKGIFLPDLWLNNPADGREFWGVYNTSITFVHPFKFGFEDYAPMNKALVKHWILEITNSLTTC